MAAPRFGNPVLANILRDMDKAAKAQRDATRTAQRPARGGGDDTAAQMWALRDVLGSGAHVTRPSDAIPFDAAVMTQLLRMAQMRYHSEGDPYWPKRPWGLDKPNTATWRGPSDWR